MPGEERSQGEAAGGRGDKLKGWQSAALLHAPNTSYPGGPGGPGVKDAASTSRDAGSIPDQGPKILHGREVWPKTKNTSYPISGLYLLNGFVHLPSKKTASCIGLHELCRQAVQISNPSSATSWQCDPGEVTSPL